MSTYAMLPLVASLVVLVVAAVNIAALRASRRRILNPRPPRPNYRKSHPPPGMRGDLGRARA